ncbi:MAG: co-chaperone GroES [bacterium]|nr:co-chaperone GroES [bacterium]
MAKNKTQSVAPKIFPLGDKALIKVEKNEKENERLSGIIIPATVKEDRGAKRGTVVAVGEGRYEEGKLIPMKVKSGDEVLFQWGDEITVDGVEYHMVGESSILAVIK